MQLHLSRIPKITFLVGVCCIFFCKAEGKGLKGFIDYFSNYDSCYIAPNKYNACAMLLGEQHYAVYTLKAEADDGHEQELRFSPVSSLKLGPYLGYSLLFLGYTINIGTRPSDSDHSNLYLSIYTKPFGIDCYYESNNHDYRIKRVKGFDNIDPESIEGTTFSGMNTYKFNLHTYFIFNNKKFSYPAAYSQTTNQLRSAGSVLLGFNYTREKIDFDYTKLPHMLLYDEYGEEELDDNLKVSEVKYRNYSFSCGYAYNWVFAKNCLANLTLTPTLGYNFSTGERFNAKEKLFNLDALNFDFISRAAIVWNNAKYFVGFSGIMHTYSYKKPSFSMRNAMFSANIYAGFNFWKKKKYRNQK